MTLKKVNKYFLNVLFGILDGKITRDDFKYYIYQKDREADSNTVDTLYNNFKVLGSALISFLDMFDNYAAGKNEEKYLEELGKYLQLLITAYILVFTTTQNLEISFSGQKLGAKAADGFDTFPDDNSVPILVSKVLVEYSMYDSGVGASLIYIIKETLDGLSIELTTETKDALNTAMDEASKNRPFNVGVLVSNFRKRLQEEDIL